MGAPPSFNSPPFLLALERQRPHEARSSKSQVIWMIWQFTAGSCVAHFLCQIFTHSPIFCKALCFTLNLTTSRWRYYWWYYSSPNYVIGYMSFGVIRAIYNMTPIIELKTHSFIDTVHFRLLTYIQVNHMCRKFRDSNSKFVSRRTSMNEMLSLSHPTIKWRKILIYKNHLHLV